MGLARPAAVSKILLLLVIQQVLWCKWFLDYTVRDTIFGVKKSRIEGKEME